MISPLNIGILVTLKDLFPKENAENRLHFIEKYSKETLLFFFSGVNCYHPRFPHLDYTQDEQFQILRFFLDDDILFHKYATSIYTVFDVKKVSPGIFTRQASLMALEEILSFEENENPKEIDIEDLLKYYLSINTEISKLQISEENVELTTFESISKSIGTTAETFLLAYPYEELIRGIHFCSYLRNHEDLGKYFEKLVKIKGMEPEILLAFAFHYVFQVTKSKEPQIPTCSAPNKFIQMLLESISNPSELSGTSSLEILKIKKAPFYKLKEDVFLMLDPVFVIEKAFKALIYDLWFDVIKPTEELNMSAYMGKIGYFFEDYVGEKIKTSFPYYKYPAPKVTDELIAGPKNEELADFYVRHNKKVLLGQVKASFINSKMKFNTDAKTLYRHNKRGLYKTFGLYQMIASIQKLLANPEWIDEKFPKDKKIQISPIIVYADRFLQTPLMNVNFQKEFIKQLQITFKEAKIPTIYYHEVTIKQVAIKPLTLMYIADLETMEPYLAKKKISIWQQVKKFYFFDGLQSPFTYSLMATQRKLNYNHTNYLFEQIRPKLELVDEIIKKPK